MKKYKVLFICKKRLVSGGIHASEDLSSGLYNSALFVSEMLNANGIESKVINVIDNNCIDREVKKYKPTDVVIEALWVVPEKFKVLVALHPTVKWDIRLHSEIPFLGNEGIAMHWLYEYIKHKNVTISANTRQVSDVLTKLFGVKVFYTPNYYPIIATPKHHRSKKNRNEIHISCFGAIRPFKNQFIQAISAIQFANSIGKKLVFHMNGSRIEQKGDEAYKNIKFLFENNPNHKLILHDWMPHNEFVKLIVNMDIAMQVSFTETFNICTADAVANNIPVVVSNEIFWVNPAFYADPTNVDNIISKLNFAYLKSQCGYHSLNKVGLENYNRTSIKAWKAIYSSPHHIYPKKKDECIVIRIFRKIWLDF